MPRTLSIHRLNPKSGNWLEIALVEEWEKENANEYSDSQLQDFIIRQRVNEDSADIAGTDINGTYALPIGELTEDMKTLMATVVQWMGTPCGQAMMEKAQKKAKLLNKIA